MRGCLRIVCFKGRDLWVCRREAGLLDNWCLQCYNKPVLEKDIPERGNAVRGTTLQHISHDTMQKLVDAYYRVRAHKTIANAEQLYGPLTEQDSALAELFDYAIGVKVIIDRANRDEFINGDVVRGAFYVVGHDDIPF